MCRNVPQNILTKGNIIWSIEFKDFVSISPSSSVKKVVDVRLIMQILQASLILNFLNLSPIPKYLRIRKKKLNLYWLEWKSIAQNWSELHKCSHTGNTLLYILVHK